MQELETIIPAIPFNLTFDQKNCLNEIIKDMMSEKKNDESLAGRCWLG